MLELLVTYLDEFQGSSTYTLVWMLLQERKHAARNQLSYVGSASVV